MEVAKAAQALIVLQHQNPELFTNLRNILIKYVLSAPPSIFVSHFYGQIGA